MWHTCESYSPGTAAAVKGAGFEGGKVQSAGEVTCKGIDLLEKFLSTKLLAAQRPKAETCQTRSVRTCWVGGDSQQQHAVVRSTSILKHSHSRLPVTALCSFIYVLGPGVGKLWPCLDCQPKSHLFIIIFFLMALTWNNNSNCIKILIAGQTCFTFGWMKVIVDHGASHALTDKFHDILPKQVVYVLLVQVAARQKRQSNPSGRWGGFWSSIASWRPCIFPIVLHARANSPQATRFVVGLKYPVDT